VSTTSPVEICPRAPQFDRPQPERRRSAGRRDGVKLAQRSRISVSVAPASRPVFSSSGAAAARRAREWRAPDRYCSRHRSGRRSHARMSQILMSSGRARPTTVMARARHTRAKPREMPVDVRGTRMLAITRCGRIVVQLSELSMSTRLGGGRDAGARRRETVHEIISSWPERCRKLQRIRPLPPRRKRVSRPTQRTPPQHVSPRQPKDDRDRHPRATSASGMCFPTLSTR